MPKTSIFMHRSVFDYLDHLAENILGHSRSETIEAMLRYIFDNDLESEVWEGYDDGLEEFEKQVEDYEKEMAPIWEKEEEEGSDEESGEESGEEE